MTTPGSFDARLASARMISPSVRELVFEREGGEPVDFEPGQWVNLLLTEEGEPLKRAYSIASPPLGSPRFELAVTLVEGGPGSMILHDLPLGATLRATGPQGFFSRAAADPSPALFVATGTGVTPFRSMLLAALAAKASAPLWILFGARHEEDILYAEEMSRLTREHPNVRFEVTLSQPRASWTGRRGYVQTHVRELWSALCAVSPDAAPHMYICGLERMVKAVRELARKEIGVDRKQVHVERYD